MNRDAIKQAAGLIEELEKLERELADLNRDDIVMQVALHDKANGFTRISEIGKPELAAVLNGKREAVIKALERRGLDLPAQMRSDEVVKPSILSAGVQP